MPKPRLVEPAPAAVPADAFRAAAEAAADGVLIFDAGERACYANRAAARLLESAVADIIGRQRAALLDFPSHEGAQLATLRRGGGGVSTVPATRAASGEGGAAFEIVILHADPALRAGMREQPLRSLLETAPDAIVIIDESGVIQSVNGVAERLFGHAAQEMVGCNVAMLMPPPYREGHDGYIERYLRTGERRIIGIGRIVVGQRADGSVFPMELYIGELHSGGRRLFSGFVRDLTAVQRVERRLQDLQAEFQKSVRLGSMGRMMTSLAHELNQPMAAILSYTEAAQEMLAHGAPAAIPLGKAVAQAQRAGAIIRRMRDFMARAAPARRAEDLNTVVVEASALALGDAEAGNIRVTARLDESLPMVLIDKAAVQEVLYHLMRNAVEAMRGREGCELTIETLADPDRVEASVVISDTGPGLSPELRAQLYAPFMGASDERHGVGLAICREIVEGHGGRLVATDRPGGGASFRFTLPVAAVD